MAEAGLGAAAAIRAATAGSASALGLTDVGTVEPGRIADLLVVDGDPLEDPAILLEPERIRLVHPGRTRRRRHPVRRRPTSDRERAAAAPRGGAAVAAHRGLSGRLHHDRLHALAGARTRAPIRRLRRPVALVGRRPRGILGLGRGLLRDPAARRRGTASWPRARCPAPAGSRAPSSTTPRSCSAGWRPIARRSCSSRSGTRCARSAPPSCATRSRQWRPVCGGSVSVVATASSRSSRTSPRRSSRCWRAPASGRSGRAAPRISGRAAWSIASPRSSRRCSSPSMATRTAGRRSIAARSSTRSAPSCRPSSAPS